MKNIIRDKLGRIHYETPNGWQLAPVLPVIFRMFKGELCAYFPTETWDMRGLITCYAHVGQHGGASVVWLSKGRPATPEEYADLLAELKGIYESDDDPATLKVYKRATGHADRNARRRNTLSERKAA